MRLGVVFNYDSVLISDLAVIKAVYVAMQNLDNNYVKSLIIKFIKEENVEVFKLGDKKIEDLEVYVRDFFFFVIFC